jgi:AhpD family alkylhydroperoxidase
VSQRLEYWRTAPEEFKALISLQRVLKAGTDERLFDLLSLRVSQLNGCPFCVDLHAGELRKSGETDRRIDALMVWRDTPFFSERERAVLDWAECLTSIREARALDGAYKALPNHFSDREITLITFAVSVINAINRVAIGFARKPQPDASLSAKLAAASSQHQASR